MGIQLSVTLIIACLVGAAFFSAAETAIFSLQRVRLQQLMDAAAPKAKRVARLKDNPERFLSTVLLGNAIVNTALSALVTSLTFDLIGHDQEGVGLVLSVGLATLAIVVVGEMAPKTLASRFPERLAFFFVRPFEVMELALLPLSAVLHRLSSFLVWPFRLPRGGRPLVSGDELRALVRLSASEGTVDATQAEIIAKAFRFGNLRASDLMTPRREILSIPRETTFRSFLNYYLKESHTCFPVYDGGPDNTIGILYVKDVLAAFAAGRLKDTDPVAPLARPPRFYPETKDVGELLREMRVRREQMVLLVDEFGAIAGLVTLKRIVGQIVGSISEEGHAGDAVERIDEHTIEVDASLRVVEANEQLHLTIPQGDYETLAGFMLANLGHIPTVGEEVPADSAVLKVVKMNGVKIERLLVTKH